MHKKDAGRRIWYPQYQGPCLVAVQDGDIYDMTSIDIPTMRDAGAEDCTGYVAASWAQKS